MILRLSFVGDVTDEPLLGNLIRQFDLNVSILYATVDYIQERPFGRLIVTVDGHEGRVHDALQYLQSLPIESEVIGYVPGNH